MMNRRRCDSMFLPSRDNAWSVTTHTAVATACSCCWTTFHSGVQRPNGNSPAPSALACQRSSFPGNYFRPQRSCPHITPEAVCLKIPNVRGTETIEAAFVAWQWRTKPPEAHMELGFSQRWECWERKPGAEDHIARIRCQSADRSW